MCIIKFPWLIPHSVLPYWLISLLSIMCIKIDLRRAISNDAQDFTL